MVAAQSTGDSASDLQSILDDRASRVQELETQVTRYQSDVNVSLESGLSP